LLETLRVVTKIFVSVLGVYIVSCVAENIKNIINKRSAVPSRNQHAVLLCTVLFISYELWQNDLASCIVTQSELNLFYVLYV